MVDKLDLIISFVHNPYACNKHNHKVISEVFPSILIFDSKGFYYGKKEQIEKIFQVLSRVEIMQILSYRDVNLSELKELLGYSYSTIRDHVRILNKLRIVKLVKGKSKKGKRELRVILNAPSVRIIPLSEKENKIKEMLDKEISTSKKEFEEFKGWIDREIKKALHNKYASKKTGKK